MVCWLKSQYTEYVVVRKLNCQDILMITCMCPSVCVSDLILIIWCCNTSYLGCWLNSQYTEYIIYYYIYSYGKMYLSVCRSNLILILWCCTTSYWILVLLNNQNRYYNSNCHHGMYMSIRMSGLLIINYMIFQYNILVSQWRDIIMVVSVSISILL